MPPLSRPSLSNTAKSAVDVEVVDPPSDSSSCLAFSPVANFLAVGSWDNNVRIYESSPTGQTQGVAIYQHRGPVLSICWSMDGTKVVSGGADNTALVYDVQTGITSQVAQHDAPIKVSKWIETPQGSILVTGSWDKTLKYWDLRSPAHIATVNLPERCYAMDAIYPLLVVGTADRQIQMYHLSNPTVAYRTAVSPLKQQTRVITCLPSKDGYAVGSIEGRVGIQFVKETETGQSYTFRCHRNETSRGHVSVHSVNDISFHPVQGTFSTAGSDGVIHVWDKDARSKIKTFDAAKYPIVATAFNHTGKLFAYAISYDWSKGYTGVSNIPNKVKLHFVEDDEVARRAPLKSR